ncbi:hypothetical protein J3R30DRAFT_3730646 [Lentinula aciculospora]|uniref:CYTH domain-containing protein n=1 Tax=Lentinula aciculospora TaxID=153920 RepID=A0A9W9DTA8_9AGAR|nr:hypothetical protein J3R30DRAFT_3730646 [Lentinula aciculospora]
MSLHLLPLLLLSTNLLLSSLFGITASLLSVKTTGEMIERRMPKNTHDERLDLRIVHHNYEDPSLCFDHIGFTPMRLNSTLDKFKVRRFNDQEFCKLEKSIGHITFRRHPETPRRGYTHGKPIATGGQTVEEEEHEVQLKSTKETVYMDLEAGFFVAEYSFEYVFEAVTSLQELPKNVAQLKLIEGSYHEIVEECKKETDKSPTPTGEIFGSWLDEYLILPKE